MSKVGYAPIKLAAGVSAEISGNSIKIKGPKGELSLSYPSRIKVEQKDDTLLVTRTGEDKATKSTHGAIRATINHMVAGVVTPWSKSLEIKGTGYKFSVNGAKLTVLAGYIHPVIVEAPTGITFVSPDESKLTVSGCDKIVVGQVASNIRKIRTPEPYKGKGIRYSDEFIKLKPGKTAKA